jgi:GNAT superfamily N-acetyltransferase
LNHIRPATKRDLIAITAIYNNTIRHAEWLPNTVRRQADFASASVGEIVHVSYNRKTGVQGFISVWEPESFVHHLYVDPRFQAQGVGTSLLDSLHVWLPRPWTQKCVDANISALAFYLARGWKVIGSGDGEHGSYSLLEY